MPGTPLVRQGPGPVRLRRVLTLSLGSVLAFPVCGAAFMHGHSRNRLHAQSPQGTTEEPADSQ